MGTSMATGCKEECRPWRWQRRREHGDWQKGMHEEVTALDAIITAHAICECGAIETDEHAYWLGPLLTQHEVKQVTDNSWMAPLFVKGKAPSGEQLCLWARGISPAGRIDIDRGMKAAEECQQCEPMWVQTGAAIRSSGLLRRCGQS